MSEKLKRCDTCDSWCTDCPYLLRGMRAEECCQFWKAKLIIAKQERQ